MILLHGSFRRTPFRCRLFASTLSVIAALSRPIASRIVDFPEPFAPINTFTFPGSKDVLYKDLKFPKPIFLSFISISPFFPKV